MLIKCDDGKLVKVQFIYRSDSVRKVSNMIECSRLNRRHDAAKSKDGMHSTSNQWIQRSYDSEGMLDWIMSVSFPDRGVMRHGKGFG